MGRKITTQEVKKRIREKHGNTVLLVEETYKNTHTKCDFIDLEYGKWNTLPSSVIQGHGHPKRGKLKRARSGHKRVSIDEIKKRLMNVHENTVLIKEKTYCGITKKCIFVDCEYGEWAATPNSVLGGSRHPSRAMHEAAKKNSIGIGELKKRLFDAHNGEITVVESTYVNMKTKCTFVDCKYGAWDAIPANIINGHGHPDRWLEKSNKTCMAKYGVKNSAQSEDIKKKMRKTSLEKYGTSYPVQAEFVRNKIKDTFLDKYGVDNPFKLLKTQDKIKSTIMDKYGVDNVSKLTDVKEKKRQTCIKNNGVENPFQSEEIKEKIKQTNMNNYGAKYPMQSPEIALKAAKSSNNSHILYHWFTGEELVCVGSYEKATVEYFNANRINFEWQPKSFRLPGGSTYRPDCYLPDRNIWVEVKGYFRKDAEEKWNWFHWFMPNSELWNKNKLEQLDIL